MKTSYHFFSPSTSKHELEMTKPLSTRQSYIPSLNADELIIQHFFSEFNRLYYCYKKTHFHHKNENLNHLIKLASSNLFTEDYFVLMMRYLFNLLDDNNSSSHLKELLIPLLYTGFFISSQNITLLQPLLDNWLLITPNILKKNLPKESKNLIPDSPSISIEDILLRSIRDTSLLDYKEYLLSKGFNKNAGTVFYEILKSLPKNSATSNALKDPYAYSYSLLILAWIYDIKKIILDYKSIIFSYKSKLSLKIVEILEKYLSKKSSSLSEILVIMTHFLIYHHKLSYQASLARKLFHFWQAGLWIMSQNTFHFSNFIKKADCNEKSKLLNGYIYSEFCWESSTVFNVSIGDYLMRIAHESHQPILKQALMQRGFVEEKSHFVFQLKQYCSATSLLKAYLYSYNVYKTSSLLEDEASLILPLLEDEDENENEDQDETSLLENDMEKKINRFK